MGKYIALAGIGIVTIGVFATNFQMSSYAPYRDGAQGGAHDVPPYPPAEPGDGNRLIVQGSKLFDGDGNEVHLRGYNWANYRNMGDITTAQNTEDVAAMGATAVRVPLRWYWGDTAGDSGQESRMTEAPGHINPAYLALLDQYIQWAADEKLWVVLFIGSDPIWNDPEFLQEFAEMWEFLAERYKDTPYIGAYELLSEPHPGKPYTNEDVKAFYQDVIAGIREHDTRTPIIVGPAKAEGCNDGPYDVRCLEQIYMGPIPNMMYTFNFYEPPEYVKADKVDGNNPYPGWFTDRKSGEQFYLDKTWISNLIAQGVAFKNAHNVPMFVNQIGLPSQTFGSEQYTRDSLDVLTQNGIGFTWWLYTEVADKDSLYEGGRGVVWEDVNGVWHRKEPWIALLSEFFRK